MSIAVRPTCRRLLPAKDDILRRQLVESLDSGEATTAEVAGRVHRRRLVVLETLQALATEGRVERCVPSGRSHVRRWRLTPAGNGVGTALSRRHGWRGLRAGLPSFRSHVPTRGLALVGLGNAFILIGAVLVAIGLNRASRSRV